MYLLKTLNSRETINYGSLTYLNAFLCPYLFENLLLPLRTFDQGAVDAFVTVEARLKSYQVECDNQGRSPDVEFVFRAVALNSGVKLFRFLSEFHAENTLSFNYRKFGAEFKKRSGILALFPRQQRVLAHKVSWSQVSQAPIYGAEEIINC